MTKKLRPALAPMCFRKLKTVDPELGKVTGEFWATVWGTECAFELIVELEQVDMAREKVVEQLKTQLKSQIGFEGE